jgi:hypothetical protein
MWISTPKYISHRGNLNGRILSSENHPEYIIEALNKGFEVEIDLWVKDKELYLGHDEPQYRIGAKFLDNSNFWIHAKNVEALTFLSKNRERFNYFWHTFEPYVLTSKGYVWPYPGEALVANSVSVLPETVGKSYKDLHKQLWLVGICSDNIAEYKEGFEKLNKHKVVDIL